MNCDNVINNLSDEDKRKAREWYDSVKGFKLSPMTAPYGTGTKPEPEQDERTREAFEKEFTLLNVVWDNEIKLYRYVGNMSNILERQDKINRDFKRFKSGYTSRNAEIEDFKLEVNTQKEIIDTNNLELKMLLETIEALKAEIEELRCCGNCDNLRATPQDHDFCWSNNGNLPSERICKDWTRKAK